MVMVFTQDLSMVQTKERGWDLFQWLNRYQVSTYCCAGKAHLLIPDWCMCRVFPEVCSWVSSAMTGARVASPKEGGAAVLTSLRKEAAWGGLGQSLPSCHLGALPGVRKQALHMGQTALCYCIWKTFSITFVHSESWKHQLRMQNLWTNKMLRKQTW